MLALGTDRIRTLEDRWTVITADRSLSGHYEHSVAVTEDGPRVLTGGGIWESVDAVSNPRAGTTTG